MKVEQIIFDKKIAEKCMKIILDNDSVNKVVSEMFKQIEEKYILVLTRMPKENCLKLLNDATLFKMLGKSDYINKCIAELHYCLTKKN